MVGVVADTKTVSLKRPPRPTVYLAAAQSDWYDGGMNWVVRGSVPAQQLQQAIAEIEPRQKIERLRPMDAILARTTADSRFDAWLFGLFAALALVLTAIGVYGLLAFSVARRTNEIGTRMALGASRFEVLRMVLRQGLGLIAIGLALGLAGAFAVTRSLTTLLFGVRPTDPLSFAAVASCSWRWASWRATFRRAARRRWIRSSRCGTSRARSPYAIPLVRWNCQLLFKTSRTTVSR